MLANGEEVGDGSDPKVDIAVDPLEGTRLCALGMPNALAVIALAERGAMFDPGPCVYMEKMAGGDDVADLLDLDRPIGETIGLVAERKGMRGRRRDGRRARPPAPRGGHRRDPQGRRARAPDHRRRRRRRAARGLARARPRPCCGASAARPRASSPRPASSAWAARWSAGCGRATTTSARRPRTPATTSRRVLTQDDLVKGEDAFFSATGVTDGDVLQGVRYHGPRGASTESLVMRTRSGTVRRIMSVHDREKLRVLTGYAAATSRASARARGRPAPRRPRRRARRSSPTASRRR